MKWSFGQNNKPKQTAGRQGKKNLRIASPCSAKWEEMKGTDWMRHCTECNLNVYNFSAMTWKEVERLVAGQQGRLCARFYRRADGTVLTQDCPKGLRAVARRVSRWAGAALSAITVVNCGGAQQPSWSRQVAQARNGKAAQTQGNTAEGNAAVILRVKDLHGSAVSTATVALRNEHGEQQGSAVAVQAGQARLQSLPPGRYNVLVRAPGFQDAANFVVLKSAETAELTMTMYAGPVMGEIVAVGPDARMQKHRTSGLVTPNQIKMEPAQFQNSASPR